MTRKRANSTKNKNTAEVKKRAPPNPLMKAESQYFQELVNTSNSVTDLKKQKSQFQYIINKLNENRKKVQKDEVKLPVSLPLIPNVMNYQEHDKKKVLKLFDEQITNYKNSLKALEGQMQQRQEQYEESAIRTREFLIRKYGHLKAKAIVPERKAVKDEENLFEAEFSKLLEDPETMKEFNEAKKKATKVNTERATKTPKKVEK